MPNLLHRLGPGLLFAGAAVGVSHLVYSTKAGALYGFGLVWAVIIANLFKYPFFEFGPRYALATQTNLLQGYQRLGRPYLALFMLMTLGTMFTVQAAVTLVTASLTQYLLGFGGLYTWASILLLLSSLLIFLGRYSLLDRTMKMIILALTIFTLLTVFAAALNQTSPPDLLQVFPQDLTSIHFLIALMGWMPAPLDLSVWHSIWALEKQKEQNGFQFKQAIFDFNVGYIGTIILALFFLSLGALQLYGKVPSFAEKPGEFSKQLIELYTQTLGPSFGWFVGLAAFITMFSTTLTCLDALPKSMAQAQQQWQNPDKPLHPRLSQIWLIILLLGTAAIFIFFSGQFAKLLNLATILSFLTAPFFAFVNYRLIYQHLPKAQHPPLWIKYLSWAGFIYLIGFSIYYLAYSF
jgi:Mn2+/Fe2+ NRAMP family transporter